MLTCALLCIAMPHMQQLQVTIEIPSPLVVALVMPAVCSLSGGHVHNTNNQPLICAGIVSYSHSR